MLLAAGCGVSRPVPPRPTVAPLTTAAADDPPLAVTVQPLATPSPSSADGLLRPRPPGPLLGDLIDATPEAGLCPDPYLTPTASPEATEPPPDDATPTPARIAHPTEVPTPAAPDEPPLRPDATLERLVRDRLGDAASHYAVVIKDLSDGRGVIIDGGRVFYAASLFKMEVMYEIFHQREEGLLSFDERYVATDYYAGFGLGPRLVAQCATVSIADALYAMMTVSDNTAAVILQDRAGAGNINNAMAALGLADTSLTEDQTLPTTAADMARLLEAIARGQAVSRQASQEMLDLMAAETINDRIPRYLPYGTLVAHKTGNWQDATHDAGIVYGPKSAYVVVLLSDLPYESDAWSVEADIAKIAWDYFERP